MNTNPAVVGAVAVIGGSIIADGQVVAGLMALGLLVFGVIVSARQGGRR